MSIEIKSDILAKELNQGIVPLGVPKAYQYDAALVEAARASVNQGIDDVAEAGDTAVNSVKAQESTSTTNINTLGDKILAQMKLGYGYPFTAANAAAMTDTAKIYVYTGSETGYTNGNWYYWNGTAWTSGGVYNATALETDKTLTVSGAAADAATVGFKTLMSYGENILDASTYNPNNFAENTVYLIGGRNANTTNNYPIDGFNGNILTLSGKKNIGEFLVQIAFGVPLKGFWYRTHYKNWTGWIKVADERNFANIIGTTSLVLQVDPNANASDVDCNNLSKNRILKLAMTGKTKEETNAPIDDFNGNIITLNGDIYSSDFDIQFACSSSNDHRNYLWYRCRYSEWNDWNKIKFSDDAIHSDAITTGSYAAFTTMGCVGDSLCSGESAYVRNGNIAYVDLYDFAWGNYMARATGNTYKIFSFGGATAKSWLDRYENTIVDSSNKCMGYIIALGENDINHSYTLGSSADINLSDYTQNADSFYGNYGKIIQLIKSVQPRAKIFTLMTRMTGTNADGYRTAIASMSTIFDNVYTISDADFQRAMLEPPLASHLYSGHFDAVGYKYIANIIAKGISDCIDNNPDDFKDVQFIGTDYYR